MEGRSASPIQAPSPPEPKLIDVPSICVDNHCDNVAKEPDLGDVAPAAAATCNNAAIPIVMDLSVIPDDVKVESSDDVKPPDELLTVVHIEPLQKESIALDKPKRQRKKKEPKDYEAITSSSCSNATSPSRAQNKRSPSRGTGSSGRGRSPVRGRQSPSRGGHSPGRVANSPGRGGHSPGRVANSPGRGGHSPGRGANSPGRGAHSPGRVANSPGRGGQSPARRANSPGRGGHSPARGASSPGRGAHSPGRVALSSGHHGQSPGRESTHISPNSSAQDSVTAPNNKIAKKKVVKKSAKNIELEAELCEQSDQKQVPKKAKKRKVGKDQEEAVVTKKVPKKNTSRAKSPIVNNKHKDKMDTEGGEPKNKKSKKNVKNTGDHQDLEHGTVCNIDEKTPTKSKKMH